MQSALPELRAARWSNDDAGLAAVRALVGPDRRPPRRVSDRGTLKLWQLSGRDLLALPGWWVIETPAGDLLAVQESLFALLNESRRIDVIGGEAP